MHRTHAPAESGVELLEAAKAGGEKKAGVLTPATAMGTSLLRDMERELPMKWECGDYRLIGVESTSHPNLPAA